MSNDKAERVLRDGLTVRELIEELSAFEDNAKVVFTYNYGDHWRSQVAETVKSLDEHTVKWSEYHSMLKVTDPDHDDEETGAQSVVVINL